MLYNPFMPSVHFADHAVFGGGGGGGPAIDPNIAIDEAAAAKLAAEKAAAEKKAKEDAQKAAADQAGTDATEYAKTTAADLAGSRKAIQDKINTARLEIGQLQAQDQENPEIVKRVEAKQAAITKLETELTTVGQAQGAEMGAAQQRLMSDALIDPASLATKTEVDKITATPDQFVAEGTGDAGKTTPATADTVETAGAAVMPEQLTPASIAAAASQPAVQDALKDLTAPKGEVSTKVDAAFKDPSTVAGTELQVEQIDDPTKVVPPPARVLEPGEALEGSSVDMAAVQEATDIKAAQADPSKKATVKGQLAELMTDFEGDETPAWAAGAMRAANAAMIARGIGTSSMAGQAIVQAAMESAIPIAQQDASTFAKFESQNLSNRQQTAMFAAEQRASFLKLDFDQAFQARVATAAKISDIANINFTADQQIALENARMAQTVDITNLNAKNAKVMADAAAMASMDLANLSNIQQAEVENAKNFLAMDMANLSNEQQATMFKAKSLQDAILSDTAAKNAAIQFNATSENQTNQFMASMNNQVQQFNVSQSNAMDQFNVSEVNAIEKFNSEQSNARDQFNTTNSMIIAQSNAQWRQGLSTANMAAQNEANMQDAAAANAFTASTVNNVWQRERDLMSFAWKSSESHQDRINNILIAQLGADAATAAAATQAKASKSGFLGAAVMKMFNWGG